MKAVVNLKGVLRRGRTHSKTANRTPTKATSVAAMAGSVRRMSMPAATPRAKAKAA